MKRIASVLGVGVFGAFLLLGPDAEAQPTATTRTAEYTEHTVAGDQVVKFGDDMLVGPLEDASIATIRGRPGVIRCPLIRPRMNFVSELLKSVENF